MMGLGSVVAPFDQAASDVRFLIELAKLMVDPAGTSEQIKQFIAEGKKAQATLEQIAQRERALTDRERIVTAREAAVSEAEGKLIEQTRAHATAAQQLEDQRAAFNALRAEVRGQLAA